jgi:hypothetical protein
LSVIENAREFLGVDFDLQNAKAPIFMGLSSLFLHRFGAD